MGGSARSTLVFCVGRMHCRDRSLNDTCQTEEKMVNENDLGRSDCRNSFYNENDLGRSDCRNSFYNKKSIGSTSMERSTTVFEL